MPDAAIALTRTVFAADQSSALLPLRLHNLTYAVDGQNLIDNISLDLNATGVTTIIGPNGAGKSLLIRLLHGLLTPSHGEIRWNAKPMGDEIRARQAMVFQKPVLLRRSVADNIDFVLKLNGRRTPERRDRILEEAGLLGHARQPARLLSGGEQQRLALARALATEPEVLFLDEPTASLDPASILRIEETVGLSSRRGVKVILVTHDIGQAKRLSSDVVFIHGGRVMSHQPADVFFTAPSTREAKAYLEGRIVV